MFADMQLVQPILFMTDTGTQRIIHSLTGKPSRHNGRLLRGNFNHQMATSLHQKSIAMEKEILSQLQYLPRLAINKKRSSKSAVESNSNIEQIIIMESGVFPSIYYRKATLRTVLKEFCFPNNVVGLPPKDQRVALVYQIVVNLFSEITFFAFNILVGEDHSSGSIFVFFSDAETIPYSKCCNLPVYIELCQNGSGRILCNSAQCESRVLAEFLINFEDGKKLWKHIRYFSSAAHLDQKLRSRISRLISNGKHKRMNLSSVIQDTSRQIAELLEQPSIKTIDKEEEVEETSPFITNARNNYFRDGIDRDSQKGEEEQQADQPQEGEGDLFSRDLVNQLPEKFMSKTYSEFQSKISEGLVNEGKVFHKDFDLIKRIDQQLLDKRRTKNSTAINFPRLMSEFRRDRKKIKKPNQELEQIRTILNNSIL